MPSPPNTSVHLLLPDRQTSVADRYWGIGIANLVVAFMSLPFPTPRAANAASNKSEKPPPTLSANSTPAGPSPFGPLFGPLLASVGITTWPLLRLFVSRVSHCAKIAQPPTEPCVCTPQIIFYSFFFFYVATEIGFSAWVSPYATLEGLEKVLARVGALHQERGYQKEAAKVRKWWLAAWWGPQN